MKSRCFHLLVPFIFLTGTLFTVPSMPVHATNVSVTNTNDSGPGSLRAAVEAAVNADTSISSSVTGTRHADGATYSTAAGIPRDTQIVAPNLVPYAPEGWDFPIVPSAMTGTNTVSTLYTYQNTYIDWAVINNGGPTSTTFYTRLYYDNSQVGLWYTSGLAQDGWAYVADWILNLTPTPGEHTLKIVVDATNVVAEINESDNTWEHSFIWNALPNLTPYMPGGWDYPVVPSATTGTHTVSTLYTSQNTYIDWAVLNNGGSTSTTFSNCLAFDNVQVYCWTRSGLPQNTYTVIIDWVLSLTPTPGPHTLKIIADADNDIVESNENDNTWEHSFTWILPPNLVPYAPAGWDFPIVPSATTGTHTVSTLYTTQNTYIDLAVINTGVATSNTFQNCLYYDNSQVNCWTRTGLSQNTYFTYLDWVLNLTPTPGPHTLKIVTDVYNDVVESNESDNTWEHAFTWHGPDHTVTFDANGGLGIMPPQTANVPTALKPNAFTRSGYTFAGWNTSPRGDGTAYADGATYSFAADVTLYAQWTALPNHTVTFNANGGTGSMSPQTANVPTALTLNNFTRSGYSFDHWETASGDIYANGAIYSFAADITLYAQWTALPNYTIFLPIILR